MNTPTGSPLPSINRRSLLGLTAATGLGLGALAVPAAARDSRPTVGPRLASGLFTLGVGSGDPWPDGFTLWTRLAPEPLALDGSGGMPATDVPVDWEVATDPAMSRVVSRGTTTATPAGGHSVHVDVTGLQPGREYWYRFRANGELTDPARSVTAPAAGAALSSFVFAFASCQNYPEGYYTAFADMAQQDLSLVVHLGDYIYEGAGTQNNLGRAHTSRAETFTLADYRLRYAQYHTDPDLQAAHAHAPWVVAPDDHEVENNWAGDISQVDNEPDQDPAVFRQRRAAAFQAYWENLPLRRSSMPRAADMQIYRRLRFGDMLQLDVLDTRRYRDDQITDPAEYAEGRFDARRTMLGRRQEGWLLNGLSSSDARWNVLGNQVFAFEADHTAGEGETFSNDTWDNYAAARERMFRGVRERGIQNFVMVTGDAHRSTAADLKLDFSDPSSPTVGTEFLGTSITSGGNGSDDDALGVTWMAENPHMKFHNKQRGYQLCHLGQDSMYCEYRVVDKVTVPDAPVRTRAKVHVEAGRPGIAEVEQVSATPA